MAKVMFCVPPIKSDKGQAQATQGRQYQYFKDPTYIYPIMPACFASMLLSEPGQEFLWLDAIAEEMDEKEFRQVMAQYNPEYMVFEANTMLITQYTKWINELKKTLPNAKIFLCGEHVTARMDECKAMCQADFFIHGGKWYFDVYKQIIGREWNMVLDGEPINGQKVYKKVENRPLPHIDRHATRSWLYAYANGNFKHVPATYTQVAQDCWYRPKQACTFCTWVVTHPENVIRDVYECLDEVEKLINIGFKEFFDDSGTFPVGKWLTTFCNEMIERGYNEYIVWGCNMRFGALKAEDYQLMAKAGCRFILWGYESGNQSTLDRLHKGYELKDVMQGLVHARKANIWNHLTVMSGYWWETLEDERRTFKMVKWLLLNDWAASMQSTVFMPYPGTKSFQEAKEEGVLLHEDWARWDMTEPIVKLKYDFSEILKLQRDYYNISFHPKFIFNKLKQLRTWEDFKFYTRLSKKVIDRFGNIPIYAKEVNA